MTRRHAIKTGAAAAAVAPTAVASKANANSEKLASGLKMRFAEERGMADHGWLKSAHSFSFANYFHPDHMQFESLRVINDDFVAAGQGFPKHPHRDAEIFSYILEGELEHDDSMGNGSVVKAGGVQYMSAGRGVTHSEFNPSKTAPVKFLQIWLLPNKQGGTPRYDTLDISPAEKDGKLKLFLSKDGQDGSMLIHAGADIYAATLTGEQRIKTQLPEGHKGWVQVAKGAVSVNGERLRKGDGLSISEAGQVIFEDGDRAEFIYFDLEPVGDHQD